MNKIKSIVKTIIARLICYFTKRHTREYMKAHSGKFHQFYRHNGGGVQCICPKCGHNVIFDRKAT